MPSSPGLAVERHTFIALLDDPADGAAAGTLQGPPRITLIGSAWIS